MRRSVERQKSLKKIIIVVLKEVEVFVEVYPIEEVLSNWRSFK